MKAENHHFFSWDERRDIAHPGDARATLNFATEHFINCAKEAIKAHDFFVVALSGGSTPKKIFEMLAKEPYASDVDWKKVLLFWSDERSVPPQDPANNFRMAMEAGLKTLPIQPDHIFRMEAEENIETHAAQYEECIRSTLSSRPFDLVMLGMGEDGHTASLFPNTKALGENTRWVVANQLPDTWRMTMTYPCINRARNIVIYVLGENKADMVGKVFLEKHEPPYPVSLIGSESNKALWVVDTDAGKKIL